MVWSARNKIFFEQAEDKMITWRPALICKASHSAAGTVCTAKPVLSVQCTAQHCTGRTAKASYKYIYC